MMKSRANTTFARSIDSIGWGLFFMWVGVALLASFSWSVSLIGTAAIILLTQGVLFLRGHRMDIFMTAVGIVLLVGAATDVYDSLWSLFPAMLIVVGIAMLADALRRPKRKQADAAAGQRTSASSIS